MKNILVLGGNRFFGKRLVELLLKEGHQVAILTRGQSGNPFGDEVEHIVADRTNKDELREKLAGKKYDIVYDNICFSPNDALALCEILDGKTEKLVFTSTLSVYPMDGKVRSEEDFDPYHYEIHMGEISDFTYGEGKRQAEAVFFQHAKFPVVAVRIPIVLGVDDYTRRLHFHIERVQNGEPIQFVSMEAEMSFIHAKEAAQFLKWVGFEDVEGPYNATAHGRISLENLMKMIEEVTGKSASIILEGNNDHLSPYAVPQSWYMTNEKAEKRGFRFTNLDDWLRPLIEAIGKSK